MTQLAIGSTPSFSESASDMTAPENFAWACEISLTPPCLVATGEGYLSTSREDPQARGVPSDIVQGRHPGFLLSASTLLEVHDDQSSRWVVLERDDKAPSYPGMWQFPAGRLSPCELPLQCAMRELVEEVRLFDDNEPLPFAEALYRVGGDEFDWLTCDSVHVGLRARHVFYESTVEFYYHATLKVPDVGRVRAEDNEPYGRQVRLLSTLEVEELIRAGKMCPSSAMLWAKFQAEKRALGTARTGRG